MPGTACPMGKQSQRAAVTYCAEMMWRKSRGPLSVGKKARPMGARLAQAAKKQGQPLARCCCWPGASWWWWAVRCVQHGLIPVGESVQNKLRSCAETAPKGVQSLRQRFGVGGADTAGRKRSASGKVCAEAVIDGC